MTQDSTYYNLKRFMESESKGKVVLVTGASGGIGSAIARAFAQEGARGVLHWQSNRGRVNALAREIGKKASLTVRGDLSKEDDVRAGFAGATRRFDDDFSDDESIFSAGR